MMNCEEYQQTLGTDPEFKDESGHVDGCASCGLYRAQMLVLNEKMKAAMEITVPELKMPQLADADELNADNVVSLSTRRAMPKPAWFALAATVLLAAFVGIRMSDTGESYPSLQEQVLAHVDREPGALRLSAVPVSDSRLVRAVPQSIATMNHEAGLITYAQSCMINGKSVPHLVIQGERGPITILLMPYEKISAAITIDGDNVQGLILPIGDGSIAIIGNRGEPLEQVKQNVLSSVTWST